MKTSLIVSIALLSLGDILVAADQMGDSLQILKIDQTNGTLTDTSMSIPTPHQPSFVAFIE